MFPLHSRKFYPNFSDPGIGCISRSIHRDHISYFFFRMFWTVHAYNSHQTANTLTPGHSQGKCSMYNNIPWFSFMPAYTISVILTDLFHQPHLLLIFCDSISPIQGHSPWQKNQYLHSLLIHLVTLLVTCQMY